MKNSLFSGNVIETKLIDKDLLTSIFMKSLYGVSETELINMMYSKYEAIIDYAKLCKGEKTGEKISMLFNPHRYSTPTKKSKSIIEAFKTESFLSGLARATLFKEGRYKELLYQVLQLGINGIQYVNEFPPYVARNFCIKYSAKKVLDPCAGWGGRMIGVASVGGIYHGFEPATKTYEGLLKLGDFLKSFKNGFDFKIECSPFEDAKIIEKYDLAITSPPYYDTEIYSEEETNSCNRYKSFEKWKNDFYIPLIEKTITHSKRFIINVGSRGQDLKTPIFEMYPDTEELKSTLSGVSGLGKKENGKESFFLIKQRSY